MCCLNRYIALSRYLVQQSFRQVPRLSATMQAVQEAASDVHQIEEVEAHEQAGPYPIEKLQVCDCKPKDMLRFARFASRDAH